MRVRGRAQVEYEIIGRHGSFQEQITAMSRGGVVMMAHGAAATNSIFQVHRSVFIEVFPFMRKRFGFMQAATASGMFYYPIFTWEKVCVSAPLPPPTASVVPIRFRVRV